MVFVIVSGYFDPLHVGHLEYFEKSKDLMFFMNDKYKRLIVIVNNDKQAILKKGKSFMNEKERVRIIKSVKLVDEVILSIDEDRTVNKTLEMLRSKYPDEKIIFANGGDVSKCSEEETCNKLKINLSYGMGNKIQSSSELIKYIKGS